MVFGHVYLLKISRDSRTVITSDGLNNDYVPDPTEDEPKYHEANASGTWAPPSEI